MLEPVFAAQPGTTFAKTRIYFSVCPGAKPETTFAEHARRGGHYEVDIARFDQKPAKDDSQSVRRPAGHFLWRQLFDCRRLYSLFPGLARRAWS